MPCAFVDIWAQQEQNVSGALNRSNLVLGNKSMEPNEIVPLFKFLLVISRNTSVIIEFKWTMLPTRIQCSDGIQHQLWRVTLRNGTRMHDAKGTVLTAWYVFMFIGVEVHPIGQHMKLASVFRFDFRTEQIPEPPTHCKHLISLLQYPAFHSGINATGQ